MVVSEACLALSEARLAIYKLRLQPMRDLEPLLLDAANEPNRLHIQLYDYVLQDLELTGKRVFEIGSGREADAIVPRATNMQAFISEVERVLKPGGIFCWADLRRRLRSLHH